MHDVLIARAEARATPVELIFEEDWPGRVTGPARAFAEAQEFKGQAGRIVLVPDAKGALAQVLYGLGAQAGADAMLLRQLPSRLPPGDYALSNAPKGFRPDLMGLAWGLGS